MSEQLDRRIAIEVMGEEEPKVGHHLDSPTWRYVEKADPKSNKVWYEVEPAPFSSVLEEALRAVDKRLADWRKEYPDWPGREMLTMEYHPEDPEGITFGASFGTEASSVHGTWDYGTTLPEAICNLLLTLETEKK